MGPSQKMNSQVSSSRQTNPVPETARSEAPSTRTVGTQTQTPTNGKTRSSAGVSNTGNGPKTQPKLSELTEGEILALIRARERVADRHIEQMMGFMGETML